MPERDSRQPEPHLRRRRLDHRLWRQRNRKVWLRPRPPKLVPSARFGCGGALQRLRRPARLPWSVRPVSRERQHPGFARRFVRASCRFAIARTPTTSRVDTAILSRSNRQPGRSPSPPTPHRCLCPAAPQMPTRRRRPCALALQIRATPRLKHLRRKPGRGDLARRTSHGPS
jgi:hypothetical protein